MKGRWGALASIILCCLLISGCSFSTSSKHSSKSSSSPSRSSSKGGGESVARTSSNLQEEVQTLTILYVSSSGSAYDFQRELGRIATGHGVIDWQRHPPIYTAIGLGVKRAGIAGSSGASLPFLEGLQGSPYYHRIQDAYL